MYAMYFFLYCNLLQLTLVEGLLLPFLYIHTCVIFNKCIQTLNFHLKLFQQKLRYMQLRTLYKK